MEKSIQNYIRYYGWEALLALLLSASAIVIFAQGFYIPDAVADSFLVALLVSAVVLAYCFAGNYNRRTMRWFAAGYVCLVVLLSLLLRVKGTDIVDQEGSQTAIYIYYIAALVIPSLVFVLSRFRLGIVALFLAGIYMYALMDFLHFETKSRYLFLYLAGAIVLFLLRQYRIMTLKNSTVEPEFGKFSGTTTATSVSAMLLALLLFAGIVRPLDPPTSDFKLITKLMNYDVLEMLGIAQQYQLPDQENESNRSGEEQENSNQQEDSADKPEETEGSQGDDLTMGDAGASAPEDADDATGISYAKRWWKLIAALLVLAAAALAAAPFLRKEYRKRTMQCLQSGSGRAQVIGLYEWYMKLFGRIGFRRPENYTEREYAALFAERLAPYLTDECDLQRMTEVFLRARYGGEEIAAEECHSLATVYPAFLENYKRLHGRFKYMLRYFVL